MRDEFWNNRRYFGSGYMLFQLDSRMQGEKIRVNFFWTVAPVNRDAVLSRLAAESEANWDRNRSNKWRTRPMIHIGDH